MENPSCWTNATKVIADALVEFAHDDYAQMCGFSPCHFIKLKLEEAGYLTPEALELLKEING